MESELSAQTKLSMQQVSDQVAAGNQASFGEAQSYFGTTPENTQIAIAAGNSPGVQYSPLTSNIDTSTFYQPNLNALASSVSIPQFDTSYTVQSGNSIAQIARDYYGDERYAGIILAANGMSSDYQSLSHLQVGTQLTLPDVSQLSGSQLNGALSAGGDIINDYQVTSDEVTARAQLAQAAANQQEQQASLDAFNSQADLTIQDTWEEPIITAKVGPMNPVDAFLMDHPTLGGALQGVADFLGTPQRINEGILNLEHDAVGGIKSLFTGQSYQPQNGIVQLYANEGAGRGTVDLVRGTVESLPIFSLAAAGNDQFALGRALPGTLGALAGFGELGSATPFESGTDIVQRVASDQASSGIDSLVDQMSPAQQAAYLANPSGGSRFLGQVVHSATADALQQMYPDRFIYSTVGPDFIDTSTGEIIELTTPNAQAAHMAKPGYTSVNYALYTLPGR